uniref:Uncharacterized protein n=1 Tax=Ditylenchus dipsaci TaxID=166011 RepID=A0A915CRE1_9BILA
MANPRYDATSIEWPQVEFDTVRQQDRKTKHNTATSTDDGGSIPDGSLFSSSPDILFAIQNSTPANYKGTRDQKEDHSSDQGGRTYAGAGAVQAEDVAGIAGLEEVR